jgi:hypothetical protein
MAEMGERTLVVLALAALLGCGSAGPTSVGPSGGGGTSGAAGSAAGAGGSGGHEAGAGAGAAGTGAAGAAGADAGSPDVADDVPGSPGGDAHADVDLPAERPVTDAGDAAPDVAATPAIRFVGRIDRGDPKGERFAWSGSGIVAAFTGTSVGIKLGGGQQYTVLLDGVLRPKLVPASTNVTSIATGLTAGPHLVELYRRSEAEWGESQFLGFDFGGGALLPPPPAPERRIEAIGDSISTGFGDEGTDPCQYTIDTQNHYVTWEAVAARAVSAELITTAWQGKGAVCNVGDGPCTNPFPTYYDRTLPARMDSVWSFSWQPHVVVINLGTNDFSSAVDPTPTEFATGYAAFLRHIRGKYAGALILCTCGPMLGSGELKKARDGIDAAITMVGDARIKAFDLPIQSGATGCIGHPNVATHQKMADVLVARLKAELGW